MKNSVLPHSKPGTRRRRVVPAVALTALAVGHIGASAQNLIQNGSFEEPVVGSYAIYTTGQTFGGTWLVESATPYLDIIGSWGTTQPAGVFYPTPAGAQFCYLADNVRYSVLRQDIATPLAAGITYELTFLQSTFYPSYGPEGGEVTVELAPTAGAPELTRVFSLSDHTDWTERSLLFTPAESGPYTLRFSSTRDVPGNLDDVRLVESTVVVPEPAACGLLAGLGLLGVAGWRRREQCRTMSTPAQTNMVGRFTAAVVLAGTILVQAGVRSQTLDPWETLNAAQPDVTASSGDIGTDASGTALFSVGSAADVMGSTGHRFAVVQASTDGGNTWSVVDKFRLADGSALTPTGIAVGPDGILWVCGYAGPADGSLPNRWLVRKGTPGVRGSMTWQVSDDFQLARGQSARASDVTTDAFGNVFVTGRAADASGVDHWITRKLAAP